MVLERGAEPPVACLVERRLEHDALRIAHAKHDGLDERASDVDVSPALTSVGWPMAARQTTRGGSHDSTSTCLSPASVRITIDGGAGRPSRRRGPASHGREAAHAVARHLGEAAVSVVQPHLGAVTGPPEQDQPVGAGPGVARAQLAGKGRTVGPAEVVGLEIQEVVAVRVGLQHIDGHGLTRPCGRYFRQNASRCHPNRRTSGLGMALNVPTKRLLYRAPFQPPCRRDFTGKRS